ncbi:hypothetical protein EVAR_68303_1 [Eumeta japonica]|uniref:Uncharacterized protein n=1 Tax=Eumeta variegata TaxID=151549 RepID=A0A4C1SUJ1_EUMVA|nr:hypothetical protein EVAR_68303_1 [Eumeta japonica]
MRKVRLKLSSRAGRSARGRPGILIARAALPGARGAPAEGAARRAGGEGLRHGGCGREVKPCRTAIVFTLSLFPVTNSHHNPTSPSSDILFLSKRLASSGDSFGVVASVGGDDYTLVNTVRFISRERIEQRLYLRFNRHFDVVEVVVMFKSARCSMARSGGLDVRIPGSKRKDRGRETYPMLDQWAMYRARLRRFGRTFNYNVDLPKPIELVDEEVGISNFL